MEPTQAISTATGTAKETRRALIHWPPVRRIVDERNLHRKLDLVLITAANPKVYTIGRSPLGARLYMEMGPPGMAGLPPGLQYSRNRNEAHHRLCLRCFFCPVNFPAQASVGGIWSHWKAETAGLRSAKKDRRLLKQLIYQSFDWSGKRRGLVAHIVRDDGVAGSNPATPTSQRIDDVFPTSAPQSCSHSFTFDRPRSDCAFPLMHP